MKKKSLLAVLCTVALSVSLLAGCGSSADRSNGQKTEETADSVTETTDTGESEESANADDVEGTAEEPPADDDALFQNEADSSSKEGPQADEEVSAAPNQLNTEELLTGRHHAEIVIKDYGTIKVELDADTAPISVTNFVKLSQSDFYDGLTFHRIIDGFMMQGGDPEGNGTGGSDETIKGEFQSNGVENDLSHKRGVISMARSQAPDSASSQFFIVQKDATYLDGQYAAFGTVTEGMEIVDEICKDAVPVDSNGLIDKNEQPVIETIDIID